MFAAAQRSHSGRTAGGEQGSGPTARVHPLQAVLESAPRLARLQAYAQMLNAPAARTAGPTPRSSPAAAPIQMVVVDPSNLALLNARKDVLKAAINQYFTSSNERLTLSDPAILYDEGRLTQIEALLDESVDLRQSLQNYYGDAERGHDTRIDIEIAALNDVRTTLAQLRAQHAPQPQGDFEMKQQEFPPLR